MSNEVNTTKFYRFLASFESKGGWEKVADSYGKEDGTVIKSEFRSFMNAEWNGNENGELTNDLINSFWKKIDTNTSATKISGTNLKNLNALDGNEMANLDKKLEVYVQFDQFIADNIAIPDALSKTGSQWKADVIDELTAKVEEFIKAGANGDLEEILFEALPSIANKNTAEYCAVEYQEQLKNGLLADYPDYKVADDDTLQALIKNYVDSIDGETDDSQIMDEIKDIMNAYLATAGIGEGSEYDLSSLGYDASKLNDIQLTVIVQTIKKDLSAEASKYEGFETYFEAAVQKFVDRKLSEGGNFEDLVKSSSDFAKSPEKTQLDNVVSVKNTYSDIKASTDKNSFYQKLVAKFGQTLADKIANNERYLDAYNNIISDAIDKVNSGELTMDKVEAYILEQIGANLNSFFANGLGDMSIEDLNNTYNKLYEAAEAQKDPQVAWAQHRTAAISYCDAIVAKGDAFAKAVYNTFGQDYKAAINQPGLLPGDIKAKMDELIQKVNELNVVSVANIGNWTGIPESGFTLKPGETKSFSISAPITLSKTDGNGNTTNETIAPNRVSYSVKNVEGGAAANINALGKLTVTAPNAEGYVKISVAVMVDGVEIGTKDVSIKCEAPAPKNLTADELKNVTTSFRVDRLESKGTNVKQESTSIADIIKGEFKGGITLSGYNTLSGARDAAKSAVGALTTNLVSILSDAGFDTAQLNQAKTMTDAYYTAIIDQMTDIAEAGDAAWNGTVSVPYGDGSKQLAGDYAQFAGHGAEKINLSTSTAMVAQTTGSGLRIEEAWNYDGGKNKGDDNRYCIGVNAQAFLNMFIKFANM